MLVLRSRRIILADHLLDGYVAIRKDRITHLATIPPPGGGELWDLGDLYLSPGFIDLQVNGYGGISIENLTEGNLDGLGKDLARTGVTSFLLSVVSYERARLREYVDRAPSPGGGYLGLHLEGPFVNPAYAGAHNPTAIRPADLGEIEDLLACGRSKVRMVTLAPERDRDLAATRLLLEQGLIVAVGHSSAELTVAHAAFDAGARAVTHLMNAMAPFHHRDPGLVGAALTRDDVYCSVIADGQHLAPATLAIAYRQKGADRLFLITDSIPAAGQPEGTYDFAGVPVTVRDGAPHTRDGRLAGSILTLDRAVRNAAEACGIPVPSAVRMASSTPASLLGLADRGTIAVGKRADLVAFDDELSVRLTVRGGVAIHRRM